MRFVDTNNTQTDHTVPTTLSHPYRPEEHPFTNIVDILLERARTDADDTALLFLLDGVDAAVAWSYRDLALNAARIATALIARDVAGKRVVLLYEPGLEYIAALFGVLQAGAVAVPSFTPAGTRALARIGNIIADATPDLILSSARMRAFETRVREHCPTAASFEWLATDELAPVSTPVGAPPVHAQSLALLQYTSGSTGNPKGVMISHANLLSNCVSMAHWMGPTDHWMGCSWLPPYHDMGLMGGILQPIYAGFPVVLMSPTHFIQSPARWLRALSKYRVTTTVAPNFAFDLCSNGIEDDELDGIDLSAIEQVFCGAEPIRTTTFERFHRRFAPYGFRFEAFNPCYGLAEATLFVSGKPGTNRPRTGCFDPASLDTHRVAEISSNDPQARLLVSCGAVAAQHRVRIVDPVTLTPCAPEHVGEIWVSGPSTAQGYWQRDDETRHAFGATLPDDPNPYLRTGDLGFLHDGELFVTGRLKDVIIIAGRNHYPQDIEATAQHAHPDVRANGVVAFAVNSEHGEALALISEVRRSTKRAPVDVAAVRHAIMREIAAAHGIRPHVIFIGPIGTVPLTTSGKVQRRACRQLFLNGALTQSASTPASQ